MLPSRSPSVWCWWCFCSCGSFNFFLFSHSQTMEAPTHSVRTPISYNLCVSACAYGRLFPGNNECVWNVYKLIQSHIFCPQNPPLIPPLPPSTVSIFECVAWSTQTMSIYEHHTHLSKIYIAYSRNELNKKNVCRHIAGHPLWENFTWLNSYHNLIYLCVYVRANVVVIREHCESVNSIEWRTPKMHWDIVI